MTDTYEAAEDVANNIISDEKEKSDLTGESVQSFTLKQFHNDSSESSESMDDSYKISATSKKWDDIINIDTTIVSQNGAVATKAQELNPEYVAVGTETVFTENNTAVETQITRLITENNSKKNDKPSTTLETDTESSQIPQVNFKGNMAIERRAVGMLSYSPACSNSSLSEMSGVSRNNSKYRAMVSFSFRFLWASLPRLCKTSFIF